MKNLYVKRASRVVPLVIIQAALVSCGGAAAEPTSIPPPPPVTTTAPTEQPPPEPTEVLIETVETGIEKQTSTCVPLQFPDVPPRVVFDAANGLYYAHQLIVTGSSSAIDSVLGEVGLASGAQGLRVLDEISLGYAAEALEGNGGNLPGDTVVRLYQLPESANVLDLVREITVAAGQDPFPFVFADPNYIVVNRTHAIIGSPDTMVEASAGASMMDQWIWQDASSAGNGLLAQENAGAGQSVEIAVFDSSPFAAAGLWSVSRPDFSQPGAMDFCVSLPTTPYFVDWQQTHAFPTNPNRLLDGKAGTSIEHGLFVAGLAKAVAPSSSVHVVRVLDHDTQGDMYTLVETLSAYLQLADARSVINLSLGFHVGLDDLGISLDDTEYFDALAVLLDKYLPGYGTLAGDEPPIVSLRIPFLVAEATGHVVVAAAGNGGDGQHDPPISQFPAVWPEVLSVGASNQNGKRACFSHASDVMAPGGEGDDEGCQVAAEELTGLVTVGRGAVSDSGYGGWTGTSFSAPQVSGLAAWLLSIEAGETTPARVRCLIKAGAEETGQVINIPATLEARTEPGVCPIGE